MKGSYRGGVVALGALLAILAVAGLLAIENFEWIPVVVLGTWLMTTGVVGALVMKGRSDNPVGPLMVAASVGIALWLLFSNYATFVFKLGHRDLPAAEIVAWLTLWTSIPAFALFIHLLLRFPSGEFPSAGWRWISRLTTLGIACTTVGYALRPGPIDTVPGVSNPFGELLPSAFSQVGIAFGDTVLPLVGLLAVVSLFVRFRRASAVERQQMKWFILAVSLFPVLFLISQVVQIADDSEDQYLGFLLIVAALLFVPISMGIGILKHRLYDIDVVLNRTLVYGGLTGFLGAAYLGIVVVLQRLLEPVTQQSDLAVAGSTLAVAAMFRPARTNVQAFIDRRFYRRKYDATQTLDEFSGHLRDRVDLDSLNRELVGVVARTMQPAHASLWLRTSVEP